MRDAYFAFDASLLAEHQGRRLLGHRGHVADDFTVDTKTSGEIDIALDLRPDANQTIDSILRLARLLSKHGVSCLLRNIDVLAGTGLAGPILQDACLYGPYLGSCRNPKCSLNSSKILEVELESEAAARIARVRDNYCSISALLLHFHHKLQGPVELAIKLSSLEHEQPIAKLPGKYVAFNLEAMNADFLAATFGRNEIFEEGEILLETIVLVFERLHLRGELNLRRLFDLQT